MVSIIYSSCKAEYPRNKNAGNKYGAAVTIISRARTTVLQWTAIVRARYRDSLPIVTSRFYDAPDLI